MTPQTGGIEQSLPGQKCRQCGAAVTTSGSAAGAGLCRSCARETSPWPSKGTKFWAVFLALGIIDRLVQRGGGVYDAVVGLAGMAICLGICVAWYQISKRRERRAKIWRIPGYFVFAFGSYGPFASVEVALLRQGPPADPVTAIGMGVALLMNLILPAAVLVGAYFLVFKQKAALNNPL